LRALGVGKAVAKRSPDIERGAGLETAQQSRHLAHYQVDHVDAQRSARAVEHRVIKCKGSAQKRIVAAVRTQHHELAWTNKLRQGRGVQAEEAGVAGQELVLQHRRRSMKHRATMRHELPVTQNSEAASEVVSTSRLSKAALLR